MEFLPTVSLIDPDRATRQSLTKLFRTVGLNSHDFATPRDFLAAGKSPPRGCLLIEMRLPEMTGIEFLRHWRTQPAATPVIVHTSAPDVPTVLAAMRAGAFDFFGKPAPEQEVLERIYAACEHDRNTSQRAAQLQILSARHATLAARERAVMECVVSGLPNKTTAVRLGLTRKAVEAYRARAMRKMGAETLPELVRMSVMLEANDNPLAAIQAAATGGRRTAPGAAPDASDCHVA